MKKLVSAVKVCAVVSVFGLFSLNASAYEIKHGYSADNGMSYYGKCKNGKDLMVIEAKDGSFEYEGPSAKGKLKKGANLDKAAKKACGEGSKA